MARRVLIPTLVIVIVPLLVWAIDRGHMLHWVGSADLEVEIAVVNEKTKLPIPGAEISVYSEGGLYRERNEGLFTLVCDNHGIARRTCHEMMTCGTESGLWFTNTWFVHSPAWCIQVRAPGFQTKKFEWIEKYSRQPQRLRDGKAKLQVVVDMCKDPS